MNTVPCHGSASPSSALVKILVAGHPMTRSIVE